MADSVRLSRTLNVFLKIRSGRLFGVLPDLNASLPEDLFALDEAADVLDSLDAEQIREFSELANQDLANARAVALRSHERIAAPASHSTDLLEEVDYRLAEAQEEKDDIYRLRYRAYLREGAIHPSESERVTDRYDDLPNNFTFGVYLRGELCSSIRISVLSSEWRGSPSSEMFSDLIHPELDRGKIIIDPTRFVADPEKAKRFPELPYVTVRLGYVASVHFNADIGLANVRPEHRAFYKKVFLQEPWGEPRLYPGLLKPVGLMAANYPAIREKVFQRFPYMRSTAFERRMLFTRDQDATHKYSMVSSELKVDEPFPITARVAGPPR
jgi:hypothetical protein